MHRKWNEAFLKSSLSDSQMKTKTKSKEKAINSDTEYEKKNKKLNSNIQLKEVNTANFDSKKMNESFEHKCK